MSDALQWFTCQICGAWAQGDPPHGEGQPCPQKVKLDQAYIEMLDAQRMSHLRAGAGVTDLIETLGKLTGTDDD